MPADKISSAPSEVLSSEDAVNSPALGAGVAGTVATGVGITIGGFVAVASGAGGMSGFGFVRKHLQVCE